MTSAVRRSPVTPLCYFSLVSHYKRNAILNITAFIRFIQNLLKGISIVKKSEKATFFFIDAEYPGFISTLDGEHDSHFVLCDRPGEGSSEKNCCW